MKFNRKIRGLDTPGTRLALARPFQVRSRARTRFCRIPRKRPSIIHLAILLLLFPAFGRGAVTTPSGVDTNPLNLDPLVRQAFERFYILDYDGALARFEKVQEKNPDNPLAVDYVLDAVIFRELYRLDLLDTTFYAHDGFLTGKHAVVAAPGVAERVNSLFANATALSEQQLSKRPEDVDALFARGWARSLRAVYIGLMQRTFISALHVALQARGDNEKVLKLDPRYIDAKLVVGVHQYVTGSLPFGIKLLAGAAGITGSKSKGIEDLRDAGAHGVISSVEARTALGLFLRREARYDEAIAVTRSLTEQYPRDFLFRLELANLTKDAGEGKAAIAQYQQLIEQAKKPGYFPVGPSGTCLVRACRYAAGAEELRGGGRSLQSGDNSTDHQRGPQKPLRPQLGQDV